MDYFGQTMYVNVARVVDALGGPVDIPDHQWSRIMTSQLGHRVDVITAPTLAQILGLEKQVIANQERLAHEHQGWYRGGLPQRGLPTITSDTYSLVEYLGRLTYADEKTKILHALQCIPGVWIVDTVDPADSPVELLVDSDHATQQALLRVLHELDVRSRSGNLVRRDLLNWDKQGRTGRIIDLGRPYIRVAFSEGATSLMAVVSDGLNSSNAVYSAAARDVARGFFPQELDCGATFFRVDPETAATIQSGALQATLAKMASVNFEPPHLP